MMSGIYINMFAFLFFFFNTLFIIITKYVKY